jgi:hypothetical protein
MQIVTTDSMLDSVKRSNEGHIKGIIGVMNVSGHNFLAVIKDAQSAGCLNQANIWKVTEVKLLAFKVSSQSAVRLVNRRDL